jgi:hypothetical protein
VRVLDILEQAAATLALPHPAPQQVRTTLYENPNYVFPENEVRGYGPNLHIRQSPFIVLMCISPFSRGHLDIIIGLAFFYSPVYFILLISAFSIFLASPSPPTFLLFSIPPLFLFLSLLIHFLSFPPCSFLPTLFPSFLLHPRSCTFFLCSRSLVGFFTMPRCAPSSLSTLLLSALLDLLKVPFSL